MKRFGRGISALGAALALLPGRVPERVAYAQSAVSGETPADSWLGWWERHADEFLAPRDSSPRLLAARAERQEILAALHAALAPDARLSSAGISTARLALAKATSDPADIGLLEEAAYGPDGRPAKATDPILRESALLALGLLRRSDPARRFDVRELDRVRAFCFRAFDDEALPTRARVFAMFAIGLLGDQPLAEHAAAPPAEEILKRFSRRYATEELPIALLVALGMQDRRTIEHDAIDSLNGCIRGGSLYGARTSDAMRSFAARALGRLGDTTSIAALTAVYGLERTSIPVRRGAAVALARLGSSAHGRDRLAMAMVLAQAIPHLDDAAARSLGVVGLARVLAADVREGMTDLLYRKIVDVGDFLLDAAREGNYADRPFGALALGIVGRAIGASPTIREYAQFRASSLDVLREGVDHSPLNGSSRGAFATALGLLEDEGSRRFLMSAVYDPDVAFELRASSAVALGLLGRNAAAERALLRATHERGPNGIRAPAARALALLDTPHRLGGLLDGLQTSDDRYDQSLILQAMAETADPLAAHAFIAVLANREMPAAMRALCCEGLGRIADPEPVPSLSRFAEDFDGVEDSGAVRALLSFR